MGDSSHLGEVLKHNIFSGSSWQLKEEDEDQADIQSCCDLLTLPLSCRQIHSFPVYPARVALPDGTDVSWNTTGLYFITFLFFFKSGCNKQQRKGFVLFGCQSFSSWFALMSHIQDINFQKLTKRKGQLSIPEHYGV